MFAIIENNQVTQVGEPSVLFPNTSGVNSLFAIEQGALEVVEGERKDERFYWVGFSHYDIQPDKVIRVYSNTAKSLEDVTNEDNSVSQGLKSQWINQIKTSANAKLQPTDWMVWRKFERLIDIPEDVASARAQIIAECNAKETAINACTTVEELIAIVAPVNIEEM